MIDLKTREEIAVMRAGGRKLGNILEELLEFAQAGIVLLDIEKKAIALIEQSGGTPSFQTVKGYRWATCLCVNDVVVHGVPTDYALLDGDVLTIDIGLLFKGFHTDTAWTKIIGGKPDRFLEVGQEALWNGIGKAVVGNNVGHISQVIQKTIEGAGFSIVKSLVGHGVGRNLHEKPQVPNFLRGSVEHTTPLVEGMTIAIEPIYAMGGGDIKNKNTDGWTLATGDGSLSSVFEHSIAITGDGPVVLTKAEK